MPGPARSPHRRPPIDGRNAAQPWDGGLFAPLDSGLPIVWQGPTRAMAEDGGPVIAEVQFVREDRANWF